MKRITSVPLLCMAIASIIRCEASVACSLQDVEISRAVAERVSIFTGNGKFQRSAPLNEVLPGKIIACNPSLGLVQLVRPDGTKVWIDPIDIKLPATSAKPR